VHAPELDRTDIRCGGHDQFVVMSPLSARASSEKPQKSAMSMSPLVVTTVAEPR
jgi:hypothetical protein